MKETATLPRELTAENGAKALFMGEFKQNYEEVCPECEGEGEDRAGDECETCKGQGVWDTEIIVSWTLIKEMYKMIVKNMEIK